MKHASQFMCGNRQTDLKVRDEGKEEKEKKK